MSEPRDGSATSTVGSRHFATPTRRADDDRRRRLGQAVFAFGVIITVLLSLIVRSVDKHNENRIFGIQMGEVTQVLTAALPNIFTPLENVASVVRATNGDVTDFQRAASVATLKNGPFAEMSLWRLGTPTPALLSVVGKFVGTPLALSKTSTLLRKAQSSDGYSVIGRLNAAHPMLSFATSVPTKVGTFAISAEQLLPANHRLQIASNSAFKDLNFALYFGKSTSQRNVIGTNVEHLPLRGDIEQVSVPLGDSSLTVVATPNSPLNGALDQKLWWIIGVGGLLITALSGVTADRLERHRARSDAVAEENVQLYRDQRGIAETLQRALLPTQLPVIPGLELSARYLPGVDTLQIGGDWYNVLKIDEQHTGFIVGDVSGRGLQAATIMASLRFTIRTLALEHHSPSQILERCARYLNLGDRGSFATVLVGVIDTARHQIAVANAGHLPMLIIDGHQAEFAVTDVDLPIGIDRETTYRTSTITVPPCATVLAFTDGLVERRGESIDVGFKRLQDAALSNQGSVSDLLEDLLADLVGNGSHDDIAMLGIRWTS